MISLTEIFLVLMKDGTSFFKRNKTEVAGGNGLEHISKDKFERVYGVDVKPSAVKIENQTIWRKELLWMSDW